MDKPCTLQKFHIVKRLSRRQKPAKTKRTGPVIGPMRLGKSRIWLPPVF
jgi:hypothetical protein